MLGHGPGTQGPQIRARLGVVPQQDTLDTELTVHENLLIYGRYFDLPSREARARAAELLEFVQLTERAGDQVEPLSGGMKRRLTIARALINEPELLLLDEPTTGLDPQARHLLWDRLYRLKQRGVTLILTTHYMDEAEQLCDRLVVMDKAEIVAEGSPRELIEKYATREVLELRFAGASRATPLDGRLDGLAERIEELPDRCLLYTDDGERGARRGPRARAPAGVVARPAGHARGRLPAADRPHAGGVSAIAGTMTRAPLAPSAAQSQSNLLVYRRTWRGSLFGSFLSPLLFLAAMGIGLGRSSTRAALAALGGVGYLDVPGARVSSPRTAMQTAGFEVDLPDHGQDHLAPDYHGDAGHADRGPRHRRRRAGLDRVPADPRGRPSSWW